MSVIHPTAPLMAVLFLSSPLLSQDARVPIPEADALKEAEKGIREVYKREFASRKTDDRRKLAAQLHTLAKAEKSDQAARYVLYRDAQDLYGQAGEWKSAWTVAGEMAGAFEINPLPLKDAALKGAKKMARTPEAVGNLASGYLTLLRDAMNHDDFDLASAALKEAISLSRKLRDPSLVALTRTRKARLEALKKMHQKLKAHVKKLETSPDDPKANLAIGRYRSLEKGMWKEGLPMLAKGSDRALAELATLELSNPSSPEEQAKVGDGWHTLAEKEKGRARDHLVDRAIHWYEKAQAGLTGLAQKLVATRLEKHRQERLLRGTWVDVSSLDQYEIRGQRPKSFTLGDEMTQAKLKTLPTGAFDALYVRLRYPQEKKTLLRIEYELDGRALMVDHLIKKLVRGESGGDGRWSWLVTTPLPTTQDFTVMVALSDGHYVVYLDGKEVIRIATSQRKWKRFEFGSASTPVVLEEVKLRKIE